MKKNILLSYDYELFFGDKSGTVKQSIITPTNLLLESMEANGFRGNFFVDYLMFREFEKQSDSYVKTDLLQLKEQLKDIVKRGHRIELHLHPHWIDAKYLGYGQWDFSNFTHYSLSSLSIETIKELFIDGVTYLSELVKDVSPNYRIVAFRAGGWAIQPFEILKEAFICAQIKIDSSVSCNTYGKNQYSYFNFINAPQNEYWHFELDVCTIHHNGAFIEVPITSYRRGLIYRFIDYFYKKISRSLQPITDGTHKRIDLIEEKKYFQTNSMYTISRISPLCVLLAAVLNRKSLITYIDHPKDYSKSVPTSMKLLKQLCRSVQYVDLTTV